MIEYVVAARTFTSMWAHLQEDSADSKPLTCEPFKLLEVELYICYPLATHNVTAPPGLVVLYLLALGSGRFRVTDVAGRFRGSDRVVTWEELRIGSKLGLKL